MYEDLAKKFAIRCMKYNGWAKPELPGIRCMPYGKSIYYCKDICGKKYSLTHYDVFLMESTKEIVIRFYSCKAYGATTVRKSDAVLQYVFEFFLDIYYVYNEKLGRCATPTIKKK